MKKTPFVSFVIYLNNNELTIINYISNIDKIAKSYFVNYEYVFIDDFSSDNTTVKINELVDKIEAPITLIKLSWFQGSEIALNAGNDIAIGDFVYEIDTINSDYPQNIFIKLYERMEKGFDIIVASPSNNISNSSKLFYKILNKVSYLKLDLTTESLRLVSRRAINSITNLSEKIRYRKALYQYSGFPRSVISYDPLKLTKRNNISIWKKIDLSINIILNFSNVGGNIAIFFSFLFLLISISAGLYAVFIYLFDKRVIEGWTTIMLLLSSGFTGLFFILGIIGKYISILLIEIKNRPLYTIKSIQKLSKN